MKLFNKISDWWHGVGICTDCGKKIKVTVLSHQYAAYHDILIINRERVCKFIGFHEKQICDKCWEIFSAEMNAHFYGLGTCITGKHQ